MVIGFEEGELVRVLACPTQNVYLRKPLALYLRGSTWDWTLENLKSPLCLAQMSLTNGVRELIDASARDSTEFRRPGLLVARCICGIAQLPSKC
jgi:hypothetical protein